MTRMFLEKLYKRGARCLQVLLFLSVAYVALFFQVAFSEELSTDLWSSIDETLTRLEQENINLLNQLALQERLAENLARQLEELEKLQQDKQRIYSYYEDRLSEQDRAIASWKTATITLSILLPVATIPLVLAIVYRQ